VWYKKIWTDLSSILSQSTRFTDGQTDRHYITLHYIIKLFIVAKVNKKLIRRWDSKRELSSRRHRTRTSKYNRLVHKFRHRSTRLCVGTHVYQIHWNNAI